MNARRFLVLLLVASACYDAPNPCPPGSSPEGGQCVVVDMNEPPVSDDDAGQGALDASTDDDAGADVRADAGDDATDAGATRACLPETVSAWESLFRARGTVEGLGPCIETFFESELSAGLSCVKAAAGVESGECDACLLAAGTCAADGCLTACRLKGGADADCRACLCESGCAPSFLACAEDSVDLCDGYHVGIDDYDASAHGLDRPFVARLGQDSGYFSSGIVDGTFFSNPILEESAPDQSWSRGFTNLTPFWLANRPYLLASRSGPARDGQVNIARISPILKNGKLGAPFYAEAWADGWTEIEVFVADGLTFLLRYNTLGAPDVSTGTLRIDRIEANLEQRKITLTNVFERLGTEDQPQTWTHIEPFRMFGQTFLLFHNRNEHGKVRIDSISVTPEGHVALAPASPLDIPDLDGDYDVIETFTAANGTWYVLAYESAPSTGEMGQVRLFSFLASLAGPQQERQLSLYARYEGLWPAHYARVTYYFDADADKSYFLRMRPDAGELSVQDAFQLLPVSENSELGAAEDPRVSANWGGGWTHLEALSNVPVW